jgi:hypothetical protein
MRLSRRWSDGACSRPLRDDTPLAEVPRAEGLIGLALRPLRNRALPNVMNPTLKLLGLSLLATPLMDSEAHQVVAALRWERRERHTGMTPCFVPFGRMTDGGTPIPVVANWNDLSVHRSLVPDAPAASHCLSTRYATLPSVGSATTSEPFPAEPVPLTVAATSVARVSSYRLPWFLLATSGARRWCSDGLKPLKRGASSHASRTWASVPEGEPL